MVWPENAARRRFDVVIAGAGPVGLTAAGILGKYGVKALLLEREVEVTPNPRATNLDDEALRTFQLMGIADKQLAGMLPNPSIQVYSGSGRLVAELKTEGHEQLGFPRVCTILQPTMEALLQEAVESFESVEFHRGYSVEGFSQKGQQVTVTVRGPNGSTQEVETTYLLGCDGGRSTVRKQCDISLQAQTPPQVWLLIEARGEEAPGCFRFFGALSHSMVFVQQPQGYQRWSIRFRSEEEAQAFERLSPAEFQALLAPWRDAPRLGQVLRKRIYQTRTLLAERFRHGNAFLVGDSAHMMPPYAGQGLCSGLRDAANLGWKLAMVLQGKAHPRLLDSYETERRQHIEDSIDATLRLGWFFFPNGRGHDLVRQSALRLLLGVPWLRTRFIRRSKALPQLRKGILLGGAAAGSTFLQPQVRRADGQTVRMDAVLGDGFAAVGLGVDPLVTMGRETRLFWSRLGARALCVLPAGQTPRQYPSSQCEEVVDESGLLKQWFEAGRGEVALVRPDRFVAALLPRGEFDAAVLALQRLLETAEPLAATPAPSQLQDIA